MMSLCTIKNELPRLLEELLNFLCQVVSFLCFIPTSYSVTATHTWLSWICGLVIVDTPWICGLVIVDTSWICGLVIVDVPWNVEKNSKGYGWSYVGSEQHRMA